MYHMDKRDGQAKGICFNRKLSMKLEIHEFISSNPDWEEKLAEAPYAVKAKRDGRFVLLKYDQIRSDLSIPIGFFNTFSGKSNMMPT